jgi:oligopeptide transport system ATP-binding protein
VSGAHAAATSPSLVEARDLHKVFRGARVFGKQVASVHAVNGVSFSVPTGGSLGIVGESGSGKTTIARMLVASEHPTSGSVLLDGEPVAFSESKRARLRHSRIIQMVFQDPFTSLDPRQSLRAAVDEVQRVHFDRSRSERQRRTSELFEAVGLGSREARALPHELSGGQRQRAAIARALAAEPRVLVLDEALSALDVSVQAQILNLLADLRDQFDLTYVLISHDLAVVRQLSAEVVVMYRGEIMERGPIDSVLAEPAHPYTRRLLASVPRPGMPLRRRAARVAETTGGCPFRARCPHADDACTQPAPDQPLGLDHHARCWHLDRLDEALAPAARGSHPPRA